MRVIYCLFLIYALQACYGVNEKTSEICSLNTVCLSDAAWPEIKKRYSPDNIKNPKLKEKLKEFERQPFASEVLFFQEYPEEIIAIDPDHYSVRYVYNSKIKDQVLNGLSPHLKLIEKQRICSRIQTLLMQYQCQEGRQQSIKKLQNK